MKNYGLLASFIFMCLAQAVEEKTEIYAESRSIVSSNVVKVTKALLERDPTKPDLMFEHQILKGQTCIVNAEEYKGKKITITLNSLDIHKETLTTHEINEIKKYLAYWKENPQVEKCESADREKDYIIYDPPSTLAKDNIAIRYVGGHPVDGYIRETIRNVYPLSKDYEDMKIIAITRKAVRILELYSKTVSNAPNSNETLEQDSKTVSNAPNNNEIIEPEEQEIDSLGDSAGSDCDKNENASAKNYTTALST